jgi:C2 domain/EF-hand domain pair
MTDNSWTNTASPLKAKDPKAESLLMEKISVLQKEFSEIDVDHNNYLTKEELFTYLDRKNISGKPFDRAIALELFEHMDKNSDGEITVNEFIKTYIEADEILRKKIETGKLNKEYYLKQYEDSIKKAEEAKATERFTAAGITQGSVCHVFVLEGKSNRPAYGGSQSAFYVEVSLDRQGAQKTKVLSGIDPQWNEKFTFEVTNKDSQIRFALYDQSRGSDFEGEAIIPLTELTNQEIHDVWFELFERSGAKGKAQLHVRMQWIHSKVKYWTLAAQKWQDAMRKEEDELNEYKRYIISLHEPFEGLRKLSYQALQQAEEGSDVQGITAIEGIFVQYMKKAAKTVANEHNPGEGFWKQLARFGAIIEIIIAVLIMITRPDFADVN